MTQAPPNVDAPPLVVRDARKRFGDVDALGGVSLHANPGELVGLLGPNGAGKTTLIRAIAGRLRLDGGEVELFGQVMRPAAPRPALGVVPQEIAVYPLLTAHENLEGRAAHGGRPDVMRSGTCPDLPGCRVACRGPHVSPRSASPRV